jgi:phage terminase large subunit-like protein
VYEIQSGDDWTDPKVWVKANPNLDVSVSREYLERECEKAKDNPEYENTFKRLHLNLRTDADVRWLSSQLWDANGAPFDPATLDGRDCYAGLDLANTLDVAALVLVFPPVESDSAWYALPYLWVPEDVARARERTNRTRYDAWIAKGHMRATDGDVIDYSAIRATLAEVQDRYRLVKLAFDPWNATQFATDLANDGIVVEKFQQSLANYAEPCRRLVELLKEKQFRHGGHPVLRWMAGNVTVHTDGRGYVMPSRKKSTDKIDGITATLMGLAVALQGAEAPAPQIFWAS